MNEHDDRPVRPARPWADRDEPVAPPANPGSVTAPRPAVSRAATDPTTAAAAELDRAARASGELNQPSQHGQHGQHAGDSGRPGRSRGSQQTGLPGPRWLWWALAAVVLVAGGAAAHLALSDGEEPVPAPTVTVEGTAPVPDVAPVERGEGSALFLALPASVRQYSLQAATASDAHAASGALEGYELTYTGPLGGTEASYAVTVAQWATPEQAAAVAATLAASAGEPTASGEVMVGDVVTGSYVITGTEGTVGAATWTNGTVLVQVVGPGEDIENVYLAYSF